MGEKYVVWHGLLIAAGTAARWLIAVAQPLTALAEFTILHGDERPLPYLRHLPGDYSLARFAGCGRLYLLIESHGRPASRSGISNGS
jgi:hypothetical protein